MNELKKHLKNEILFDGHEDETGDRFNEVLFDELDRISIYHYDNKQFFNIDPDTVLHLATMENMVINHETTLDDIVREAQTNLAFNYMYNELKKIYMEKLKK